MHLHQKRLYFNFLPFKLSAIAEAALLPIVTPTPLSITVCSSTFFITSSKKTAGPNDSLLGPLIDELQQVMKKAARTKQLLKKSKVPGITPKAERLLQFDL